MRQAIAGPSIENAVFDVLTNDTGPLFITTTEETTAFVMVRARVRVAFVLVVGHPYPPGSTAALGPLAGPANDAMRMIPPIERTLTTGGKPSTLRFTAKAL